MLFLLLQLKYIYSETEQGEESVLLYLGVDQGL